MRRRKVLIGIVALPVILAFGLILFHAGSLVIGKRVAAEYTDETAYRLFRAPQGYFIVTNLATYSLTFDHANNAVISLVLDTTREVSGYLLSRGFVRFRSIESSSWTPDEKWIDEQHVEFKQYRGGRLVVRIPTDSDV